MNVFETEVLVIGGGLAGMTAALSARAKGERVTLICKSLSGHSGNSIVAGAGVSVYNPENEQSDSKELYREDLLHSGADINDQMMMYKVINESADVLPYLIDNGVSFRYSESELMVKRTGGHSAARYYYTDYSQKPYQTRGLSLTEPMEASAERAGVEMIHHASVLRLLKNKGKIVGCICADQNNARFCILAKSVVLAAGGGASLFARTNNTSDVTCDSYRLALEAGASLRDMEFVQFYPCVMFQPVRLQIEGSLFSDGAVLRNVKGEEFMPFYSAAGNKATRDAMAIAIQSEINAGRGENGCVFVDCSGIDITVLQTRYKELARTLSSHRFDVKKDYLPVCPAAHFYMGGICVDSDYSAGVPGLYACGEAVGGLHGANRLPGAALMEAVVSGRIAGQKAAEYAEKAEQEDRTSIADNGEMISSGIEWKQKIRELRAMAWKEVSIVRNEASIERFENYLEEQRGVIEGMRAGTEVDRRAYEYLSYYMTAQMLTLSAKERKESRGAHYRSDYTKRDETFAGSFVCTLSENDEIKVGFVKQLEMPEKE